MKRSWIVVLVIALMAALCVPAMADYGAVSSAKVKLYKNPDLTDADGTLSKYTAVVVKETRSGVARIRHDGETYYVPEAALERPWEDIQSAMKAKGVDMTWAYNRYLKRGCYAYVRPDKHSDSIRLKRQMVVWAIYEKDGWTLVQCNGYYGYIKSKYLEKKNQQRGITNEELKRIADEEDAREAAKLAKEKAKFLAAQEKARAAQQKAAQEKAEKEKAEQEKAEQEKAEQQAGQNP